MRRTIYQATRALKFSALKGRYNLSTLKSHPKMTKKKTLKVVELFAGVGGFRLGLEGWQGLSPCSMYTCPIGDNFSVVWSNQWEPATKVQHASDIYVERFGPSGHSNEDINSVATDDIPDHDLLVGGFPCQDYSVANQLSRAKGIEGKKGVLWWAIHRILAAKRPSYVLLENVDRLINSPANQRGRDFAILLASLSDLGYVIEWRVINAADYGMPQRRRRVFIFAFQDNSDVGKRFREPKQWLLKEGLFMKAFPGSVTKTTEESLFSFDENIQTTTFKLEGDLVTITKTFGRGKAGRGVFENAGVVSGRTVTTCKLTASYKGEATTLGDITQPLEEVPESYFVSEKDFPKWEYLKGAKREERRRADGGTFFYTEGGMIFPDSLHKPARTIITSEGGSTPSRFKHVITQEGRHRRLTPVELERANMFPDDHTKGATDTKRAFFMGNALVVGVVEKLGHGLTQLAKR